MITPWTVKKKLYLCEPVTSGWYLICLDSIGTNKIIPNDCDRNIVRSSNEVIFKQGFPTVFTQNIYFSCFYVLSPAWFVGLKCNALVQALGRFDEFKANRPQRTNSASHGQAVSVHSATIEVAGGEKKEKKKTGFDVSVWVSVVLPALSLGPSLWCCSDKLSHGKN